jgi:L-fucose mutarotase/ribose pyranase (RbsD/FucU family)
LYSPSRAENLPGYRFINFHRCLNEARVRLQEMGAGTAIVFSDSPFFGIEMLQNVIPLARTLMFELMSGEIPVRMGLAWFVPVVAIPQGLVHSHDHLCRSSWEQVLFVYLKHSAAAFMA